MVFGSSYVVQEGKVQLFCFKYKLTPFSLQPVSMGRRVPASLLLFPFAEKRLQKEFINQQVYLSQNPSLQSRQDWHFVHFGLNLLHEELVHKTWVALATCRIWAPFLLLEKMYIRIKLSHFDAYATDRYDRVFSSHLSDKIQVRLTYSGLEQIFQLGYTSDSKISR